MNKVELLRDPWLATPHSGLTPDSGAELEWWFVQGELESAAFGRRQLTAAIFRRKPRSQAFDEGWMLLVSTSDPSVGEYAAASRVSRSLTQAFAVEAPDQLRDGGMAAELADAFVHETVAYGPPPPIEVSDAPVIVADNCLHILWGDFELFEGGNGTVVMKCRLPGIAAPVTLRLRPRSAWHRDDRATPGDAFATMAYLTCPRLDVEGEAGGQSVRGSAWFDHQWGSRAWIEPDRDSGKVLGWEWLAVNLDDGRDLMIAGGRDMRTSEAFRRGGALFCGEEAVRFTELKAEATRWWSSERSHVRFPVAWRFVIPEIEAALTFEPGFDGAEIPVYGVGTAIWEGSGKVAGRIAGQPVSGRGHLELNGYALPTGLDERQKAWIDRIDRDLKGFLPTAVDDAWLAGQLGSPRGRFDAKAHTEMLCDPAWELLSRGGKHWRSIFGMLLLDALGVPIALYQELMSVVPELVHAGSLMIDDIEDASALRRGGPAIHLLFGEATTINAANTLYFLPLLAIGRHPHLDLDQRDAIYRSLIDLFVRAHFGQAQDLHAARWPEASDFLDRVEAHLETVVETYTLKTAAPIHAIAEIACIIARTNWEARAACMRFAETLGLAYQIADDVNNFVGEPKWGKSTGEDLRAGKPTYAILRALQAVDKRDAKRLWQALRSNGSAVSPDILADGLAIVHASGALDLCRKEAIEMFDNSWAEFSQFVAPSAAKTLLRLAGRKILGSRDPS